MKNKNLIFVFVLALGLISFSSCNKNIIAYEVTSITVKNFSGTNGGSNWDILDGPDIKIILIHDGAVVYESTRHTNADAGRDYTFNLNYRILVENINDQFQIQLIDYDFPTNDQLMESFSFNLSGEDTEEFSKGDFEFEVKLESIDE